MAVCSLVVIPVMVVARIMSGKYDPKKPKKESEKEKDNQADIMASDCIQHYKTVTAMASEDTIVTTYADNLLKGAAAHNKKSCLTGLFYGLSQFMTSFVFGGLFFISALLLKTVDCLEPMNI